MAKAAKKTADATPTHPAADATPTVTHAERAARRKAAAELVAKLGGNVGAAARELGVSLSFIRYACQEFGVKITDRRYSSSGISGLYAIIADFLDGYSVTDVAARCNVSAQQASVILRSATAAGIMRHAVVRESEEDALLVENAHKAAAKAARKGKGRTGRPRKSATAKYKEETEAGGGVKEGSGEVDAIGGSD